IIEKTNSLNPDVVVITGDFVDGSGKLSIKTFEQLNNIKAPTFMVMGNHEFYEGEQRVIDLLSETKVKVLRNESELIKGINIIGLDYSENKSYVAEHLKNIEFNNSKPTILLNHVPMGYEDAAKSGVKLQLSGHTHNGQIFPFTLLVKARFPKINGLYNIDNLSLYVSPGTGTWGPPMRLGSKNEITVLKLKK
ncbi:MAG: metallophosphoesterase, partial [Candidatus Woesearchaeota archaeon]